MARLMKHLKATTLIETIVAMVILAICTGLGFGLFSLISKDIYDDSLIEAEIRIYSIAVDSRIKGDLSESVTQVNNLRIQKSSKEFRNLKHLRILLIEAYNMQGKKVCEYRELVRIK